MNDVEKVCIVALDAVADALGWEGREIVLRASSEIEELRERLANARAIAADISTRDAATRNAALDEALTCIYGLQWSEGATGIVRSIKALKTPQP